MSDSTSAAHDLDAPVASLSGGNLQKVVLAREISANPRLARGCAADARARPRRGGGDAAAASRAARGRARTSSLISEELDELLALSDRIAVIYEGRITGTFPAHALDEEEIGLLMAGRAHERHRRALRTFGHPAGGRRGRPRPVGARPR